MNNEIEVTSYVEEQAPAPFVLLHPSPLQEQLIESATEMGLDVDWYKENILADEACLSGLTMVEA